MVAALLNRAIGDQLTCVFVDNGLLRLNEGDQVMDTFARHMGVKVIRVDAEERFLSALQGVAETLERMEGRLSQARQAWAAYVEFAEAHREVASPELGRARMQAIDRIEQQAQADAEVRQRIAERERATQGGQRGRRR